MNCVLVIRFHANPDGFNIKSTGFKIAGEKSIVYLTDTPTDASSSNVIKDIMSTA